MFEVVTYIGRESEKREVRATGRVLPDMPFACEIFDQALEAMRTLKLNGAIFLYNRDRLCVQSITLEYNLPA